KIDDSLTSAVSEINVLKDGIDLKVDVDGVISAINLSKETAKIQAKNIDLVGSVRVLSDITGELGDITAGNISGVDIEGSIFTSRYSYEEGSEKHYGIMNLEYDSLGFGESNKYENVYENT